LNDTNSHTTFIEDPPIPNFIQIVHRADGRTYTTFPVWVYLVDFMYKERLVIES